MRRWGLLQAGMVAMTVLLVVTMIFDVACAQTPKKQFDLTIHGFVPAVSAHRITFGLTEFLRRDSTWLRGTLLEGSAIANLKLLQQPDQRPTAVSAAIGTVLSDQQRGKPPFKTPYEFKVIVVLNHVAPTIATLNPNIKSMADLKGKTVAIPYRKGPHEQLMNAMFEFRGIKPDEWKPVPGYFGKAKDDLLAGTIDAGWQSFTYTKKPVAGTDELMTRKDTYFINWTDEEFKYATEKLGYTIRHFKIPKTSDPRMKGDASCILDFIALYADVKLPDDVAYEIARVYHKNVKNFVKYEPSTAYYTSETIVDTGMPLDTFHPGALKYYKEAKLIK